MVRDNGFGADAIDQPYSFRTFVAPSDEEAKAEAKHVVWFYHLLASLLPGALGVTAPKSGYENSLRDLGMLSQITTDDVWERGTAFGSPERVVTQMNRIGGPEHKEVTQSVKLFSKHVLPTLRKEELKMKGSAATV